MKKGKSIKIIAENLFYIADFASGKERLKELFEKTPYTVPLKPLSLFFK